ncbi:hypothetical protein A2U01_0100181, partial [Trifolium medium]|nr:hypothetical protein [Trifolium medium]
CTVSEAPPEIKEEDFDNDVQMNAMLKDVSSCAIPKTMLKGCDCAGR